MECFALAGQVIYAGTYLICWLSPTMLAQHTKLGKLQACGYYQLNPHKKGMCICQRSELLPLQEHLYSASLLSMQDIIA
eukprot:SM000005S17125  [mRNA]  locus=s5:258138:258500:- [translate_table: standard]